MFIYVMNESAKDYFIKAGYRLIKETKCICVFENKPETQYSDFDFPCVVSDTLTF